MLLGRFLFFFFLVLGTAMLSPSPLSLVSVFLLREGISAAGIGTVLINVSRLGLVLPSWLQWDIEREGESVFVLRLSYYRTIRSRIYTQK